MTKTNKKLIAAIVIALCAATAIGAGIHLIAGEGSGKVGKESAKEIALAHAGLSEAEVTLKRVELDRDDGRIEYEVEFRKDGVKYEYEIDAESGEIISYDSDVKKPAAPADGAAVNGTPAVAVTADEAKAAALAHAGLSEAEVTFTKVKLDRDDGRNEYEVEFRKDNVKYEYEIDAESGAILSYDKEVKKNVQTQPQTTAEAPKPAEPTVPVTLPATAPPAEPTVKTSENAPATTPVTTPVTVPESPVIARITADEAKKLALAHAGLAEADVSFTKVEFDRDDGRSEYEIEFRQGRIEYEYEIDAESGEILDAEKKYDD